MLDKKEIKRKYKETVTPMGIYEFRNLENDKIFIGKSSNLPGKKNSIEFQLKIGSHMNAELQKDYNEQADNKFEFRILDELEPKEGSGHDYSDDLDELFQLWIEKLDPSQKMCYNTIIIDQNGSKTVR